MTDQFAQANAALRVIHVREEFGDCVEDGEPFPCRTVQVLDFVAARPIGWRAEG